MARIPSKIYVMDSLLRPDSLLGPANVLANGVRGYYSQKFADSGYITGISAITDQGYNAANMMFRLSYQGQDRIVVEEGLLYACVGVDARHQVFFKKPLPIAENQILNLELLNNTGINIAMFLVNFYFVPDPSFVYTHVSPTQLICVNWNNQAVLTNGIQRTPFNRSGKIHAIHGCWVDLGAPAVAATNVRIQVTKQNRIFVNTEATIWDAVYSRLAGNSMTWLPEPIEVKRGEVMQAQLWNDDAATAIRATLVYHFVPDNLDWYYDADY